MSLSRDVTVWCDGCTEWRQTNDTASFLRKQLKREGWKHSSQKDFCGACVTEGKS